MTVKIQVIIAIIVIIALSIIVNMIRKKRLEIKICFGMVDCELLGTLVWIVF